MRLIIVKDADELSGLVARELVDHIEHHPASNVCLPTGGTVTQTYARFCELVRDAEIPVLGIRFFGMDEYVPLHRDDPHSFYRYLHLNVYEKLGIAPGHTARPAADAPDLAAACRDYTKLVADAGGFDLTLLGVGTDGHIAFNMPAAALHLDTHPEDLSEETRQANARFFDRLEDVPHQAITIGIGMILASKRIVFAASGASKAPVLRRFLSNRLYDPQLPVSALWLHADTTLVLDVAAASELDADVIAALQSRE